MCVDDVSCRRYGVVPTRATILSPCSASLRYAASYPLGLSASKVATISGEPLRSTQL